MARPFKDDVTRKNDRIIAKVYCQLYRWGFSANVFAPMIAKAAYDTLDRANNKQIGNGGFQSEEDVLSPDSIVKIYKEWNAANPSYFSRSNYPKDALKNIGPAQNNLDKVIVFFMKYMDQEPEKCIFSEPPICPSLDSDWWRFHNGELDGDLPLSPNAQARKALFPKIKKK